MPLSVDTSTVDLFTSRFTPVFVFFQMDDVDMDAKEPSDEAESSGSHHVFKTPMILNCCKLQGLSANDSSDCAPSSPFLLRSPDFSFSKESLLSSTQLTHVHLNETHASDLRLKEPQLLGSAGISSPRVNMPKRFDMSPDSGVDCASFYSSVKDSAILDSDEDQQSHSSSAVDAVTTPGFVSASQAQGNMPGCPQSAASVGDINKLWQSTPINADLNACPMFEDSCELEKSPSKRYKPSFKKASRDLFRNSRRKLNSSFPQPLPWEHTSCPSSSQSSMNGRETVDFLFYLGKYSIHQPALDAILGYLEPADLCRATVVSRSWKNVVEGVPSAKLRKKEYVDRCIQIKENLHQVCVGFIHELYNDRNLQAYVMLGAFYRLPKSWKAPFPFGVNSSQFKTLVGQRKFKAVNLEVPQLVQVKLSSIFS